MDVEDMLPPWWTLKLCLPPTRRSKIWWFNPSFSSDTNISHPYPCKLDNFVVSWIHTRKLTWIPKMMGLGKPVTGPFKNGVIFGIDMLDFRSVLILYRFKKIRTSCPTISSGFTRVFTKPQNWQRSSVKWGFVLFVKEIQTYQHTQCSSLFSFLFHWCIQIFYCFIYCIFVTTNRTKQ